MDRFLYQIEREEKENCIEIRIYYYDKKGNSHVEKHEIPYLVFMLKTDFEALNILSDSIVLAEKEFLDINNEKVVRIEIKSKELSEFFKNKTKEASFKVFEADLNAEHRYLIENELKITENELFTPKYLSVDIETIGDVNDQDIVLISSYSPQGFAKVYLSKEKVSEKQLKEAKKGGFDGFELEILDSEKEMLQKFREDTIEFAPQLIIGWNVIDFDFKVIKDKIDKHGLPFSFSPYEGQTKLRIINDFFRRSNLTGPGLIVFDIIDILRTNFIEFSDYKLDTVAREVLKDQKIELENDENADINMTEKIKAIENMFNNDIRTLIEYNFKDSLLTSQITEKLDLMSLMCERSVITGTPLSKVRSPIASLDIMYIKELHKRGYVAPSNFNFQDSSPIEGAFVMNPDQGFYKDVFVLDFKSLYPSIIMTFNLDPFTYAENGELEAPNGAKFVKEPGILPDIIKELGQEREKAKKQKDKVKSHAIKITMNSFYGSIASPKCRFYNKAIGEAITSFGRHIIQKAKSHMEEQDYKVLYGDTDSIFVSSNKKDLTIEKRKEEGKAIESELNVYFEKWVKEEYKQKTYLQIEFEKLFSNFFIASKKRYVGHDEFTDKTVFVGMEAIRGDWTALAKEFQVKLIEIIFEGAKEEEIKKFVHDFVSKIKTGEYDEKLVYQKKITKPLHMYTKTTPPHVKAARELDVFEGRVVKYVMTKAGPKHITLAGDTPDYDYDHYVQKQLKGVSDDILNTLGIDFDNVIESRTQNSLNKFF